MIGTTKITVCIKWNNNHQYRKRTTIPLVERPSVSADEDLAAPEGLKHWSEHPPVK